MEQSFCADTRQTIAAFNNRRRRYREMYDWGQANLRVLAQYQAAAAQAAAAEPIEGEQVFKDWGGVVVPTMLNRYQEGLQHIRELRQAVDSPDPFITGVLALAMVSGHLANFGLAVDLLALAGVLVYRKLVRAAHAPCPRCREPFGDARPWPLSVGSHSCQHCGLSL